MLLVVLDIFQMMNILFAWPEKFENDAVPAFSDVIDVPLVVRQARRSRKQVFTASSLET